MPIITPITQASSKNYECNVCCDEEFVIDGWTSRECACAAQKRLNRRMKGAMIPEDFEAAELETYHPRNDTQQGMLNKTTDYLNAFEHLLREKNNSLGFMAKVGETLIRSIKNPAERAEMQRRHNSFGLGKTHLTVSLAKRLIRAGHATLIISDAAFMEELAIARAAGGDEGHDFRRLMDSAKNAPVLVWDDLGKSKWTESREKWYYQIINARYEARRPIIFSSNEDRNTLTDKIGPAAASRLFGMANGWMFAVEGVDQRLVKGA